MKNKPENVIMTEGDPKKIIFRFAQPLIFANLFQQLYNTMDTIIAVSYTHLTLPTNREV